MKVPRRGALCTSKKHEDRCHGWCDLPWGSFLILDFVVFSHQKCALAYLLFLRLLVGLFNLEAFQMMRFLIMFLIRLGEKREPFPCGLKCVYLYINIYIHIHIPWKSNRPPFFRSVEPLVVTSFIILYSKVYHHPKGFPPFFKWWRRFPGFYVYVNAYSYRDIA